MRIIKYVGFFLTLLVAQSAIGSTEMPYVDGSKLFLSINDTNRQAEAWATCSATYDVMAMLLNESNPAQAQKFKDLGNGASMAVVMTHVTDGYSKDIDQDRFNSLWNYSKTLADSIPETMKTMILADAETLGESGTTVFITKVAATVKVCIANLEGQQVYIDTWRELAKSGWLTMPNE
jgi:hypothetical protein|tara:strand:- start:467 stop:1000 length:534 start_codon:yes stop_codon:yes gene_type:complete